MTLIHHEFRHPLDSRQSNSPFLYDMKRSGQELPHSDIPRVRASSCCELAFRPEKSAVQFNLTAKSTTTAFAPSSLASQTHRRSTHNTATTGQQAYPVIDLTLTDTDNTDSEDDELVWSHGSDEEEEEEEDELEEEDGDVSDTHIQYTCTIPSETGNRWQAGVGPKNGDAGTLSKCEAINASILAAHTNQQGSIDNVNASFGEPAIPRRDDGDSSDDEGFELQRQRHMSQVDESMSRINNSKGEPMSLSGESSVVPFQALNCNNEAMDESALCRSLLQDEMLDTDCDYEAILKLLGEDDFSLTSLGDQPQPVEPQKMQDFNVEEIWPMVWPASDSMWDWNDSISMVQQAPQPSPTYSCHEPIQPPPSANGSRREGPKTLAQLFGLPEPLYLSPSDTPTQNALEHLGFIRRIRKPRDATAILPPSLAPVLNHMASILAPKMDSERGTYLLVGRFLHQTCLMADNSLLDTSKAASKSAPSSPSLKRKDVTETPGTCWIKIILSY